VRKKYERGNCRKKGCEMVNKGISVREMVVGPQAPHPSHTSHSPHALYTPDNDNIVQGAGEWVRAQQVDGHDRAASVQHLLREGETHGVVGAGDCGPTRL